MLSVVSRFSGIGDAAGHAAAPGIGTTIVMTEIRDRDVTETDILGIDTALSAHLP